MPNPPATPGETPEELAALIAAYHAFGRDRRDDDFWAWQRVKDVVQGPDAERAWGLTVAVVRSAPDHRLEHVGAGPVEELVETHGPALLDRIEAEAGRDPRFREALASIWLTADDFAPEVIARLQDAAGHRIGVVTLAELDEAERRWLEGEGAEWATRNARRGPCADGTDSTSGAAPARG